MDSLCAVSRIGLKSSLPYSSHESRNSSMVTFRLEPEPGRCSFACCPMTRGTNVSFDWFWYRLISTASTSIPDICSFRNSTTRSSSTGIASATKSNRSFLAARFVATASQNWSALLCRSVSNPSSDDVSSCRNSSIFVSGPPSVSFHVCSKVRRRPSAVHVRTAWAAYSSICPTTFRRISGFEPRFTSTSVGTASWSTSRWSSAHRVPAVRAVRDSLFSRHQQPMPGFVWRNLSPVDEYRVIRN